ncbi:MAG: regulatory protein GemA [Desulfotignum sp.]|nr:regulatory protein GemA [Desulfotignum sp.]
MSNKASSIYEQQNKIIHTALKILGMSYKSDKVELVSLFTQIAGRQVNGLSDLNLVERNQVIGHFKRCGLDLFKPAVADNIRDWRKGDPDMECQKMERPISVPRNKKRLINKIWAVLTDLDLPWRYADGISKRMFGIKIVEWCSTEQLGKVVVALSVAQRKRYAQVGAKVPAGRDMKAK